MLGCFSHAGLFETLWTVANQAPRSMRFSRQEQWSELLCTPPGDLPDPGIEPTSLLPLSPALADGFFITSTKEPAGVTLGRTTAGRSYNSYHSLP